MRTLALSIGAALALAAGMASVPAQDVNGTGQQRFNSPDAAIHALREAVKTDDQAALTALFGPDRHDLRTGDPVQDKANREHFSAAIEAQCAQEPVGQDRIILGIGTNDWPFPIPLARQNGQWFFDTAAGREEIINRHIGRDELHAIGVCHVYVAGQTKYFSDNHQYALKFKCSAGAHDGLYEDSTNATDPLGALVAKSRAEGYPKPPAGTLAFHGYYFKILTAQGRAASGGRANYLVNGSLTNGFGLVAYPIVYGKSGIMTFVVNQEGQVYQRDMGKRTAERAASLTEYNPDRHWTVVSDEGIAEP